MRLVPAVVDNGRVLSLQFLARTGGSARIRRAARFPAGYARHAPSLIIIDAHGGISQRDTHLDEHGDVPVMWQIGRWPVAHMRG
jgi:hypothetical protein